MNERIGAVIAAGNKKLAMPTKIMGSITLIKRVVSTLNKAGIDVIVVVTGFDESTIKSLLQSEGAIFLYNDDEEDPPLLSSLNIGFKYLAQKTDRILAVPVNVPMFRYDTCQKLIQTKGDIVIPSYQYHGGHPILISSAFVPQIEMYFESDGANGLRGFLRNYEEKKVYVPVEDPGVYYSIHQEKMLEKFLSEHNETLLRSEVSISIRKEAEIFDRRAKLLLTLIDEFHTVNGACQKLSLSLSKAWNIINAMEEDLGFPIVQRKQGGAKGGRTKLTPQGRRILEKYELLEERVRKYCNQQFEIIFKDNEEKMEKRE